MVKRTCSDWCCYILVTFRCQSQTFDNLVDVHSGSSYMGWMHHPLKSYCHLMLVIEVCILDNCMVAFQPGLHAAKPGIYTSSWSELSINDNFSRARADTCQKIYFTTQCVLRSSRVIFILSKSPNLFHFKGWNTFNDIICGTIHSNIGLTFDRAIGLTLKLLKKLLIIP